MEVILIGGCFLFVLATVLCGGYWFLREPSADTSLEASPVSVSLNQEDGPIRQTLEKIGSIVSTANDLDHPIRARLIAAGYRAPDAVQAFYGIKAVAALLLALGAMMLGMALGAAFTTAAVVAFCTAGMGYLAPDWILSSMEKRRKQKLRQAMPAALDLLVLSLEAGQGLDSTLLDTSRELKRVYPDLSEELGLANMEMRAGQSRADVLDRLAQRTGEAEVKKLTNLLLDGDRFGTALGPALRNHAKYTRLRRRQLAQEKARKTSVKLVFPVFFLIFPCILLVTLGPAVLRLMEGLGKMVNSTQ